MSHRTTSVEFFKKWWPQAFFGVLAILGAALAAQDWSRGDNPALNAGYAAGFMILAVIKTRYDLRTARQGPASAKRSPEDQAAFDYAKTV